MHRNTYVIVLFLGIVAALVVGVNIGRSINPTPPQVAVPVTPTVTPQPTIALLPFTNPECGFSLSYPSSLTLTKGSSGSAVLSNSSETILMACQEDIPRPPLTQERIEEATIAGVINAKIYHDASPKDGTQIDALIFTNPNNGLDVFISGLGPTFTQIISSIQLTR